MFPCYMGEVVNLVPATVSRDTVAELESLLAEARRGEIVGFYYTALHKGRRFSSHVVGEARKAPTFMLGTIPGLSQYLLELNGDEE